MRYIEVDGQGYLVFENINTDTREYEYFLVEATKLATKYSEMNDLDTKVWKKYKE